MTDTTKRQIDHIRNGQIPTGYRRTNAGIIPSTWETKPLNSIVDEITETPGSSKIETVSISSGIGFVNQAKKFGKELSGKQYKRYIVLHRGDFSYNKGNSSAYPQGCIYRLTDREQAAVPNVFESFRICKGNADYYEQLFISGFLNQQLCSKINRGVRDNGLLNLTSEEFYSCEVPFPPLEEQQKIAEILMHCDHIISLHQKQINKLKKQNGYFLKNMFPRQGEKSPNIRFPNCTAPWEQRKLGELTDIASAARVHKEEWATSGVPFFRSSDVVAAYKKTDNEKAYITEELYEKLSAISGKLEKDDVLITGGGSIGIPYIVPNSEPLYSKDADLIWIKRSPRFDSNYLYAYITAPTFRAYIGGISHIGTIAHYTIEQVKATPIGLPTIAEQKQIGDFFRSLDNLITLHQQKLDAMKVMKKSLMQLLLTGIVRVNT